jgi:F0F1-type ATP synthase assembly protein I
MEEQKNSNIPWWQPGLVLFTRLSAWIAVPVIMAVFVGKYLDRLFHTQPWLFLISVATSFIVSMVMIVRIGLKEMDKK